MKTRGLGERRDRERAVDARLVKGGQRKRRNALANRLKP